MEVSRDGMSFGRLSPSRGPAAPDAHHHMVPQGKHSTKRSFGEVVHDTKLGARKCIRPREGPVHE